MITRIFTIFIILMMGLSANADRRLDKLIKRHKYQKAFKYIEKKYPPEKRDLDIWTKAGCISEGLGKSEKALGCYLAIVRKYPDNEDALRSLVRLYNRMRYYPNAYMMVIKLLKVKGEDPGVIWEAAKICINLKKYEEAEKYLLKIQQYNLEAQKELGYIYYTYQKYDKAIPILKAYFSRKKDLKVAKKIVMYYKDKEDIFDVIEHFEYVAENDKNDIISRLYLARYWVKESEISMAMRYYAEIPEKNYKFIDYFNIGNYKKAEGKLDDAIKFFSVIIEKGIKNSDLYEKTQIELGLIYIEQKEYKKAINYLKLVKDKVSNYDLHMARAYDALKIHDKARVYASNYLKQNPSNIQARMILAAAFEKIGYRTKAKRIRESIIAKNPNNYNIHYEMGIYYFENGQYLNAITHFEKSYLMNQNITCMEKIAFCAYKINKLDKSIDASELVLELKPDNKTVLNILYKIYMKRSKYKEALPYLIKLTQLESMKLNYFLQLSICYEKLGEYSNIITIDEKIVELNPNNVKSKRRLAEYKFKKEKYSDALNMYNDLIRMKEVKNTDYPNIINSSLKLNLKEKAVEYLEQYSRLKPRNADIYNKLGKLNFELKNYDKSLKNYLKTLSLEPNVKGIYKNYAKLVVINNWKVNSIISISEKAIKYKEADFDIYENLGDAYIKIGNYQKALDTYQIAMKIDPRHIPVFSKLAECQIKTNHLDDAIVSYEQLIILDTKSINYKVLGDLYNKKGNSKETVKNYKKYLSTNNDDHLATYVAMYEHDSGHYKDALKYFDKMTSFSRKTIYARGRSYLYTKNYKECITILTEYVNRYPGNKNYYYANKMLGVAYDKLKNDRAIYHYKIYLQKNKDNNIAYRVGQLTEKINKKSGLYIYESNSYRYPTDYRNFVKIGYLINDNKKSIISFEKAVELNDTLLGVWLSLGKLYAAVGNEDKKIEAYKRAVVISPHNFEANKYLGMILQSKGKDKEALLYLELARSINSKDAGVMYALGRCYIKEGRATEATLLLQTAKKLKPKECRIRYELINHLIRQQMYREALSESNELLNINKEDKYFDQYIFILFKLKKYQIIEKAIINRRKGDPENIQLLMKMARAQYLYNNYEEALQSYVMVSFIKEGYEPAMIGRAVVYIKMGKINNAKTYYEKVLKNNPKSMEALLGLVSIYKSSGDNSLFVEYLRKARDINPDNPTVKQWMKTM